MDPRKELRCLGAWMIAMSLAVFCVGIVGSITYSVGLGFSLVEAIIFPSMVVIVVVIYVYQRKWLHLVGIYFGMFCLSLIQSIPVFVRGGDSLFSSIVLFGFIISFISFACAAAGVFMWNAKN